MTERPISVSISKGVGDNSFSLDELYYRHFSCMPLFYFQAGSTDLYDRPRAAQTDEDVEPENPLKGPDELEHAVEKLFRFLKSKELNVYRSDATISKYCNFTTNCFIASIMFTDHKIAVRVQIAPGKKETMTSVSVMGCAEHNQIWSVLVEHCKTFVRPAEIRQDEINIITVSDGEFYLKSIPLVNHNQEFSYDFYNEDFKPVSERVILALQANNESGLILFHGAPGTGKTSYLKYLLHTIGKKKLIYLPPDLIESLSAPNFISFLLSQAANSILLIEDAENVLMKRDAGGNQAVSNILNISDGILGDILRLQIVCTFNSRLEDVDQALLRPGRLVAEYRFQKLKVDRTTKLMMKLHGNDIVWKDDEMTLADIFNFKNMPDKTKVKSKTIGFAPQQD